MELDWMVGEVLVALDRNGLSENTLVLFSSDNGGTYSKPHNAKAWNRGHRINGELLGQKGGVWEGGHRVPLLVRWPGVIEPASTSGALVSLVDIMATFSEVWETPLPENAGPDSESFLPVLNGSARTARDSTVYQGVQGLLAVRQGDWVMIPAQGSQGTSLTGAHGTMNFEELGFVNSDYTPGGKLKPNAPPGQLYNLAEDLAQQHNLYTEHPACCPDESPTRGDQEPTTAGSRRIMANKLKYLGAAALMFCTVASAAAAPAYDLRASGWWNP